MNLKLAGDVALVVGAARGIGLGITKEFLREGAHVCMLDLDEQVGSVCGALERGASAFSFRVDATDEQQVGSAVDACCRRFGQIDHVVVAVGAGSGSYGAPFWNVSPSTWPAVIRVNLMSVVNVAHACVPHMLPRRAGTMLFLSSVAGQIGSSTDPPYSAAKAAVINFTQCAARDLAPHNIRVNAICPGMVRTQLNKSVWEAWTRSVNPDERLDYSVWAADKLNRLTPLGRWQSVEDVAQAAVFLAAPCAQNITGQVLNVDGGQVM